MATVKINDDFAVWGSDLAYLMGLPTMREWVSRQSLSDYLSGKIGVMFNGKIQASEKLKARLDFERWIADCPNPGCGGSEYIDDADLFFFCLSCGNPILGGDSYKVTLPNQALRFSVYEELNLRPVQRIQGLNRLQTALNSRHWVPGLDRNWTPGQTVKSMSDYRKVVVANYKKDEPEFNLGRYKTVPLPVRLKGPIDRGRGPRTDSEKVGAVPVRRVR